MKRLILALALIAGAASAYAETEERNDTVAVDHSKIERVVTKEDTAADGSKLARHYFLYDGELVPTTRNVVIRYKLAREYGARYALSLVVYGGGRRKQIILK